MRALKCLEVCEISQIFTHFIQNGIQLICMQLAQLSHLWAPRQPLLYVINCDHKVINGGL
jgi:hypothetical protein